MNAEPRTTFVMVAERRSGTTLLIDCLNSHPDVMCIKRAFGHEHPVENPTPDTESGRFYLYRTASFKRRLMFRLRRGALVTHFMTERAWFEPGEETPALGLRVTYRNTVRYPQVVQWIHDENVKVIHLIRHNLLKACLSKRTSKVHKLGHPRDGDAVEPVKINVPVRKLLRDLRIRREKLERQRALFRDGPYLEVSYEDLVAQRERESQRLLSFLGVHAETALETDLVKINPDKISLIVSNYDELCSGLRGTEFEAMLD